MAVSLWVRTHKPVCGVCVLAFLCLLNACSSELVLATWQCKGRTDAGSSDGGTSIDFPWSTGFENGWCDYSESNGSCYTWDSASNDIVEAPVRSGRYAAAFTVTGDEPRGTQARCHLDGELPKAALYGAWYYIPAGATNSGNWNLIHWQGGTAPDDLPTLWDISLVNAGAGLRLNVYSRYGNAPDLSDAPLIPIGTWFHIEMFLKRASDETGAIAVYQNGAPLAQVSNIKTDDTTYGQWYVGNLATNLDPVQSTVYVDDVSIGPER
jgi:hypothetical protein